MTTVGPLPNSYWLVPSTLLAGEYPGAHDEDAARAKLERILSAGIRSFIDLTHEADGLAPYDTLLAGMARERRIEHRYQHFAITNLAVPTREEMGRILAAIRDEISAGRPVYLHCWGGIGRTGTVAGCWLVEQGLSGGDAIERIGQFRRGTPNRHTRSPETAEQRTFVCEWRRQTLLARYHGALIGLAAGDALGTTLEFKRPGRFTRIDDMIGGGDFELEPGQWTDDTSMAMCLAESLVERGFDPTDQMQRYVRWWEDGYWSSNGRCFDIGATVSRALARFQETGRPMAGSTDPRSAGNGSLMRLAPVPLRYGGNPSEAVRKAAESSKTTHGARAAVDACRYFAALIVGALQGRDRRELLAPAFAPDGVDWSAEPLEPEIARIAAGSFKTKGAHEIRASGFVVHTLEAALWAFHNSSDFREGALLAVNLGEDADTTGAVYGQLAGAYYGVDGIPQQWREKIARREEILRLATALFEGADAADAATR